MNGGEQHRRRRNAGQPTAFCCGHSHQSETRRVANLKGGSTWLVNPGTIAGLAAPATWVLGDLEAMRFDLHTLNL